MRPEAQRWIFLRGLGRHSQHWGDFVSEFQKKFPSCSVELMDLAGNGTEADRQSFLRIESYVKDLRGRSKLAKEGPVSILALSMGAMVAADWADQFPEEVWQLVLINSSSCAEAKFFERLKPKNYLQILNLYRHKSDLLYRERAILKMTAAQLPNLEQQAERQSHFVPTSADNLLRQILASSRFRFAQAKPQADVLLLNAKGDNFVNPVCSERLAERWQVPLETHPAGDHDLPLIDSQWILRKVESRKATGT